jgi:hypothetical protein
MSENKVKEFRIYRPNKNKNGSASAWQLSYKPQSKYNNWMVFLVVAPQVGVDDNNNAKFDWKESAITIKIGENDIAEIMAVLEGRQDQCGYKGSLFHQSPDGSNKSLQLSRGDNGYFLKVSSQDKDKRVTGPYSHSLSNGEASMLLILLKKSIEKIYNW